MRFGQILVLLALASCGPRDERRQHAIKEVAPKAIPAMSSDAKAAQAYVQRYYMLIKEGKYVDAYKMWGDGGRDTRGTLAAFAASFDRYSAYASKVGDPTEVKASGRTLYVAVAAKLRVTMKKDNNVLDQSGVVMLRRSANPKEPLADKRDWRIWGTDIRARR